MKYRFSQNSEPKVSKFALEKERRSTKYFRYVKTIREIPMDDIILSDNIPRAEESTDPIHVDNLSLFLQTAGYDEDADLTPLMKHPTLPGKYVVIDNHHLIEALKKMGQKVWMGDLWEYTGSYGEAHMWVAAGDFGLEFNNDQLITKKTSRASVVAAALGKISMVNYITEPGVTVDDTSVRQWISQCGHDRIFDKRNITMIVNEILNPGKLSGKNIIPVTPESINAMFADTSNNYGTGLVNNNRYGFLIKTDNYAADAAKGYGQLVSALQKGYIPLFITYSGKDDAGKIVSNECGYFDKMYEVYQRHMNSVTIFHGIAFPLLSKKEFFSKLQHVAVVQIKGVDDLDGEKFVVRPLNS